MIEHRNKPLNHKKVPQRHFTNVIHWEHDNIRKEKV